MWRLAYWCWTTPPRSSAAASGTLTVDSGGQLEITTGTGAHTGATLDGVIVDDNSSVTNGGIDVASGVLTLTTTRRSRAATPARWILSASSDQ